MFNHQPIELNYTLEATTLPSGRTYETPNGNRYPSITTMLGALDEGKFDWWVELVGQKEADRISRHGATRGSNVHKLFEDFLNNKDIEEDLRNSMPLVKSNFNSARKTLEKRVSNIRAQEVPLYSDLLRLAGRVDCIADFDGVLSIIDFKTSTKHKKQEDIYSYFIQCAFYAAALYERTRIEVNNLVIIMTVDYAPEPLVFQENLRDWFYKLVNARQRYDQILADA